MNSASYQTLVIKKRNKLLSLLNYIFVFKTAANEYFPAYTGLLLTFIKTTKQQ